MLVFTNTNHSYSDNTIKHNVLKYCNNTHILIGAHFCVETINSFISYGFINSFVLIFMDFGALVPVYIWI